jgi:dipeptidyl aminopeptidase/acylaminoacyl peptidase
MRRFIFFLSALVAFTFPAFAQAKHPFTFEDMMKLKRVGEPEVSPDGKWVIFSVVDVSLKANTKTPHIWIVPLDAHVGTAAPGRPAEQSSAGSSSAERILIADQDADRPRWAPDGKRFAFISNKDGGSQVWIAEFDSASGTVTAVHKLTSIATEASGEIWSPDGKNILFTSDVYPECDGAPAAEQECNARKLKEVEQSKVKAQIFDHLLYRHWNAYKEGKRSHIFVVGMDECAGSSRASLDRTAEGGCPHVSAPRDLTPGYYDAPVFSLGGQDDYAFSPDGQEICYTSNHDKNPAASTNNDLWIVPVNGAADASSARPVAKNITADNPASDSTPLYSPDGRYIAYRAQQRPGYESDQFRLMVYDRSTGKSREVFTATKSDWVGTFIWSPDSLRVYYVTNHEEGRDEGQQNVVWSATVDPVTVKQKPLKDVSPGMKLTPINRMNMVEAWARGYADDVAFSPDSKTLFFTRMSLKRPNEIWNLVLPERTDWDNLPRGEALTHFNDAVLSQIDMSPLETFWFKGAKDDDVEGFLVKPPNFDPSKKYPVKFLIHGGPQGAWGDDWSFRWNPELFAAPTSSTSSGYVVIMINFHGSTGYGQKFIDAINGDWGGAPFEDLMKGLDYVEAHYGFIDKDRECALGASYGGYMINWILGHTDRFKCLVSHDGMFNAESAWGTTEELWFNDWEFKGTPYDNRAGYEKWSPHQYAKNFKTPTLVIHGQRDYRLDVSEGLQLFTTLQMEGVPSKMLYFPDEGHWVLKPQNSQLWYKTVNDWVDQWTKK